MPVLPSTVLLTILLCIGLFFFIRASTKDRIQVAQWVTDLPQPSLLEQLQQYFTQRAYRITEVDAEKNLVTFEGLVRPSVFLAIFLTLLAAVGWLSLALILAVLKPELSGLLPWMATLSPLAGLFYWKKSARPEQLVLQVETVVDENNALQNLVIVTGHRDELSEMQRSLPLKPVEAEVSPV